jgi:HTH-type transcriptional regulator/antitoxin HipB
MTKLRVRKQQDIAAVIRAAREDAGLSQAELAEQLVFSRDYMIDLESGKTNLFVSRLLRTLHKLGVTMTLEFGEDNGNQS